MFAARGPAEKPNVYLAVLILNELLPLRAFYFYFHYRPFCFYYCNFYRHVTSPPGTSKPKKFCLGFIFCCFCLR